MIGQASVLVVVLLTACAKQSIHISEPVGPARMVLPPRSIGRLVVSTEEVSSGTGEEFAIYEDYAVLDSFGRLVKEVDNNSGADVIELEAGRYSVRAEALGRQVVAVDVEIVAGMTTEVHLDGQWKPEPSSTAATLVLGPDGSPIGYRAVPIATPSAAASTTRPSADWAHGAR